MRRTYRFSIVLFVKEEEKYRKTMESIRTQSFPEDQIQIVVVLLSEDAKKWQKKLSGQDHMVVLRAWDKSDIQTELEQSLRGEYVTFQKEGVRYHKKGISRIEKRFKRTGAQVVSGLVENEAKTNLTLAEHNRYCLDFKSKTTLEDPFSIAHAVYFAYFLKRDSLRWQARFDAGLWWVEALKIVCDTVLHAKRISYVKKPCFQTAFGKEATEEREELLQDEERLKTYYEKLLLPMEEICRRSSVLYKKNAEYVLLHYIAVMADRLNINKELANPRYDQAFDRMLKGMEHYEIVTQNRYISQLNREYLMESYWERIKSGASPEVDFLLKPEHVRIEVQILVPREKKIHTEFFVKMPEGKDYSISCGYEGDTYECKKIAVAASMCWGSVQTGSVIIFEADVPVKWERGGMQWWIESEGQKYPMKNIKFMRYTPFSTGMNLYQAIGGSFCFLSADQSAVLIKPAGKILHLRLLLKRTWSFLKKGKGGCKAIVSRVIYHLELRKQKKAVWLCMDRTNRADDNGEVMFDYLCRNPREDIEPYFVVDGNTDDWERMRKLGKVAEPFSRKHKLLFLLSEFLLSSQANMAVINPFGGLEYLYRDLMYDKRLVFLQHGLTKDDQSRWLNKYNRNLFGFIVNTQQEYDSIFEYDYYYKPEQVWLTGMPRYDRLYHNEKKYVTVMPTWRKSLSAGIDPSGVWLLGEDFTKSRYFRFYDELLNNEKLLGAAERLGYQICFMPHPNTISGLKYFHHHPKVKFMDMSYSYRDVFAETDLMVTDYSSVAFDFAYLRKPMIYAQFDREEFFNGSHSYTEGYFDYERDGFGEIEETLEQVVERVIEYMEAGCRIKTKYLDRIEKTFAFHDRNCCRRVCEKILSLRMKEE